MNRTMKFVRLIHLYLGCVFAPALLFFAVTGIMQTLYPDLPHRLAGNTNRFFSLHSGRGMKDHSEWAGAGWCCFVVAMAVSFILSTSLGLVMAFRHAKRPVAVSLCLVAGVVIPVALVLVKIAGDAGTTP